MVLSFCFVDSVRDNNNNNTNNKSLSLTSAHVKPPLATSWNTGDISSPVVGANGKMATADGSRPGTMCSVPSLRCAKWDWKRAMVKQRNGTKRNSHVASWFFASDCSWVRTTVRIVCKFGLVLAVVGLVLFVIYFFGGGGMVLGCGVECYVTSSYCSYSCTSLHLYVQFKCVMNNNEY